MAKTKIDPETSKPMPDPQTFSLWLADLSQGEVNAELSEAMQDIVEECESNAKKTAPRTVKGEITFRLSFAVSDGGAVTVAHDIKVKHPPTIRSQSTFWADRGNLVRQDPKQKTFAFGVVEGGGREVKDAPGGGREVASVGGRGEAKAT